MRKKGIMYLITGPTGKQYADITRYTAAYEWGKHCKAPTLTPLRRAIRKYGPENFIVEVIGEADSWAELCEMNVKEIRERGLQDPELGYNESPGGGDEAPWLQTGTATAKRKATPVRRKRATTKRKRVPVPVGMSDAHRDMLRAQARKNGTVVGDGTVIPMGMPEAHRDKLRAQDRRLSQ